MFTDSHGNFLLRTTSEAEQIKKQREELKKERLALKCQGSSILEREASRNEDNKSYVNPGSEMNALEMGSTIQGKLSHHFVVAQKVPAANARVTLSVFVLKIKRNLNNLAKIPRPIHV